MSRSPAVLLISPGILRWEDVDFGVPHLVSLGGYVQERTGVRVEILDLNYEGGDRRDLERRLDELGPFLVIGVSAYSSFDLLRVLSLARFLMERYPGVPLVTGGYHASALPGDLLPAFDLVIPGEAEVALAEVVETLLGGGRIEPGVAQARVVDDLDSLPPYRWELLARYWPRATRIGRKLQVYLSRGCPYRCAFCMERAKSGYSWRAYSPERAIEELRRLSRFTPLAEWTINLADPLFGFKRRWRREVLEGIVRERLFPLRYWTLTRSDDLDDDDVRLLAEARFAIGIGLESGSPRMLGVMQKAGRPEKYLDAVVALARRSQVHGLNWAVNVIVGHPGETPETMRETAAFVERLFFEGPSTRGWLSVDPFRLYPGSQVHVERAFYERTHGARFHHPEWWKGWYDGPFRAQHLDPSRELAYEARVDFLFDTYGPITRRIHERFVGPDGAAGALLARSRLGEIDGLRPQVKETLLARALEARRDVPAVPLAAPIGLDVRDPVVRALEAALRRRLDRGLVVADTLVEALLAAPPHHFLSTAEALAMLEDRPLPPTEEGALPATLGFSALVGALQALAPAAGERAIDLGAASGHVAALLAELVGPRGEVVAVAEEDAVERLRAALAPWPQVRVEGRRPAERFAGSGFDLAWLGAAVPRVPGPLPGLLTPTGRALVVAGPRFRDQDLLLVGADGVERPLGRTRAPVLGGPYGWVPTPAGVAGTAVRFERWEAPARLFAALARVDLGDDVAAVARPTGPSLVWAARIREAWTAAPGRLALQALGLRHRRVEDLLRALASPPPPLDDAPGRALCAAVASALPEVEVSWAVDPAEVQGRLAPVLERWRADLWAPQGRRPPPLRVVDVPALGPRARGATVGGEHVVATSLAEPDEHVLMQVLHEEVHPVTDPLVSDGGVRDTRPGTPGFALHQRLEETAITATYAFLAARSPERLPAFERWLDAQRG